MNRVVLANKVNLILMTFHVEQISFWFFPYQNNSRENLNWFLFFEMAAMPFPCNGILLIQGNLARVMITCLCGHPDGMSLFSHLNLVFLSIFQTIQDVNAWHWCCQFDWGMYIAPKLLPGVDICTPTPILCALRQTFTPQQSS